MPRRSIVIPPGQLMVSLFLEIPSILWSVFCLPLSVDVKTFTITPSEFSESYN